MPSFASGVAPRALHTPPGHASASTGAAIVDILLAPTPPPPPADDDPLAAIMRAVTREADADGVVVTLRDGHRAPVVLFSDGDVHDGAADESYAPSRALGSASDWRLAEGDPSTGLMTTRIPTGGGLVTVVTIFRRIGDSTVGRARAAARRLQPLLSPFVRLWAQGRRVQSQVRALTAAVDKSGIGIVLVDARGEPTFVNAVAHAMIREGDGLRRSGSLLGGNTLADTLRLQVAVEHVVGGGTAGPVVALARADRRPLLAAVVAADRARDAVAADAAAVVYVVDPLQDLEGLLGPACKLYGLSPVETRLTCLLADGMNLAAAAERMRVRELTARSYLKQIFLKTDTNRQAELVGLMLKSVVRTAPGCAADFVTPPV